MNRFQFTLMFLITLVITSQLFAHPGHGTNKAVNPSGFLHYLTEPIHLVPFAAVALFVALLVIRKKYLQRSSEQSQPVVLTQKSKQK